MGNHGGAPSSLSEFRKKKKKKKREGGLLGGHSDLTQEAVHLPLM